MLKIYKDGTDQYLLFRATSSADYTAFTGTNDGDALPGAIVIISEYKKDDQNITNPSVTWNATIGKWKVIIPAANITQCNTGELNISGTGMVPVSIEFETLRSAGGGMNSIITEYSVNAITREITITDPAFVSLKVEQILNIYNLTKHRLVYNSSDTSYRPLVTVTNNPSSCVIKYSCPKFGSFSNSDKIQIIVNTS